MMIFVFLLEDLPKWGWNLAMTCYDMPWGKMASVDGGDFLWFYGIDLFYYHRKYGDCMSMIDFMVVYSYISGIPQRLEVRHLIRRIFWWWVYGWKSSISEIEWDFMGILVGGFKHFSFSIVYGIILPID